MWWFHSDDRGPAIEICPGCTTRVIVGGPRLMFSFVEIEEGVATPLHSHPEDQMGLILEGRFERRQGGDVAVLGPGDVFFTPGSVEHSGRALDGRCRLLDVFTPPRSKYVPAKE